MDAFCTPCVVIEAIAGKRMLAVWINSCARERVRLSGILLAEMHARPARATDDTRRAASTRTSYKHVNDIS
jgi:hypothetical protein